MYREAVRGIIFVDGMLLLIEDDFGEVKLPGGGIDNAEDDYRALLREVKEETGYDVIPESIIPFGEIEEKRLSVHEPIEKNRKMLEKEGKQAWNQREYKTLLLIKDYLANM